MEIVVTPIPEKEGGTLVDKLRLDVDYGGKKVVHDYRRPGIGTHALALQMLQAASTLLRADNAGFGLSNELESTIGQLELLIEGEK